MDMSAIWAIVPVVAIGGGITYAIFQAYFRSRVAQAQLQASGTDLQAELATSTRTQQELRAAVDALTQRVALLEASREGR